MKKMRIGKSEVFAPKLTLGTFGMGGGTSWQDTTKNDQELIDFIKQAHVELGICGIDTAPVYGISLYPPISFYIDIRNLGTIWTPKRQKALLL